MLRFYVDDFLGIIADDDDECKTLLFHLVFMIYDTEMND